MKKNFYKEFQKKQKLSQNYNENDKVIVQNQSTLLKLLSYLIAFFTNIFKILIFIGIIALLSIGATVIFNNLLQLNSINTIGENL
ncbi:MAG: hypothetical protein ACLUVE_02415 [Clostridia bacterium]|jgi:hypothetical protein